MGRHLRGVDLPEAGAVGGLKNKLAVGTLLDSSLHGHSENRCPVLIGIPDDLLRTKLCRGGVKHGGWRGRSA